MDIFVKVFQSERYDNWLEGKDIGPDPKDPTNICAAPSPYYLESDATKMYVFNLLIFPLTNHILIEFDRKSKRQPSYKRQLIQQNKNALNQLLEEDDYCPEDFECEDNDNSPDYCYYNENYRNGNGEKNFKSRRKKSRCTTNNDDNNNNGSDNDNNPSNNMAKMNGCDLNNGDDNIIKIEPNNNNDNDCEKKNGELNNFFKNCFSFNLINFKFSRANSTLFSIEYK